MAEDDKRTFAHIARTTALGGLAGSAGGTAAALVGAAGGAMVGAAEYVGAHGWIDHFFQLTKNGTGRLRDAMEAEARADAEAAAPAVEATVALLSSEERPTASDYATVFELFVRAHMKSMDARKRSVLKTALENAFKRELYIEGLTKRLFVMLEDLDYGDLAALASAGRQSAVVSDPGSLYGNHLERLHARGLVWDQNHGSRASRPVHAISALGKRMLVMVGEFPDGPAARIV